MAADGQTVEKVQASLAPYDIRTNSRLAALYPVGQYPHTRRCAVLVPLFVCPSDGQLHVLLTQRSSTLRSHASNVAFPGGVQDTADRDDTHTALREAHEEIGLDPSDVTVVAHLPPVFVRVCSSVFPVVGFIPGDFRPKPNPNEVALVFSVPLSRFLQQDVAFATFQWLGKTIRTPFMMHVVDDSPPLLIWGMTNIVCIAVAMTILGPRKRFRLLFGMSGQASDAGDGDKDDDDVFGDIVEMYHRSCRASLSFSNL